MCRSLWLLCLGSRILAKKNQGRRIRGLVGMAHVCRSKRIWPKIGFGKRSEPRKCGRSSFNLRGSQAQRPHPPPRKVLKGNLKRGFDAKGSIEPFLWLLKTLLLEFYRTFWGAKRLFDRTLCISIDLFFRGSMEPFLGWLPISFFKTPCTPKKLSVHRA